MEKKQQQTSSFLDYCFSSWRKKVSYSSASLTEPFSCQPWKGCFLGKEVSLGLASRAGGVPYPSSTLLKSGSAPGRPKAVVALSATRWKDRVWTTSASVVPSSSPSALLRAPKAPSAALEKAESETSGSTTHRDRLTLAARAPQSPEVLRSLPLRSRGRRGWSSAPEVFPQSPARGKHGGGLGDGAAIFRHF